jgi:hypothetical protein
MNHQEFLSDQEVSLGFNRCESAEARIRAAAVDARIKKARSLCDRVPHGRYKQLVRVGFEAVLVDSEALDL